jgi:hypothetical protein
LRVPAALILAVFAAMACSPRADAPGGTDVARPGNPFFGSWKVETARVAPWWKGPGEPPQMDPEFQDTAIVFEAKKSSGPGIVACDAPVYAVSLVGPATLFEGNLPNPAAEAAALGFSPTDIQSLNLSCTRDQKDVSLDFAMAGEDTILLGLDNMIYTLKRQPSQGRDS